MSFDRNSLKIKALSERESNLDISSIADLDAARAAKAHKGIRETALRIVRAKEGGSSVILMIGAHVIRSGVQKYLIDLMARGYISCIAVNGACMIHDFEFALIGATTESVARYIKDGQFGLWKETARLNEIINKAFKEEPGIGMGEAVGRYIEKSDLKYKSISLFAAASRLNIPITVHVSIGSDIIHEHPNCSGAATGALSYNDFLKFASVIQNLENGVIMNFGSAVMAPEVFLKALSMARNRAHQEGKEIRRFSALVSDLKKLPKDIRKEPSRNNPAYYYRPWKNMLVRAVADGGEGFYVKGTHSETIPALWAGINKIERKTCKR